MVSLGCLSFLLSCKMRWEQLQLNNISGANPDGKKGPAKMSDTYGHWDIHAMPLMEICFSSVHSISVSGYQHLGSKGFDDWGDGFSSLCPARDLKFLIGLVKMKDFPGTPGTLIGLVLRISQCLFAAGSIASMATTTNFFNFTAFCYLIASMGLQAIWSFGLAWLDAHALVKRRVLHNPVLVSLFVVGDWVTATLSLAAASASAGITVLLVRDLGGCIMREECQKYQLSVSLAFLSWITIEISSLIMLWILATC
ncbi:hypothetical protein HHK36_022555 [Tetracentron sinense]|uniref:CASP-like protein n=1 Tax=Tetracentron sinense TaxID=13715 RepID=A0A834YT62_TETSI|nr:hypothetical protein HHK36_022555 [Tetracentron sinense]